MNEWLLTPYLTEEEKEIPLDEWLKIICDFAYERDKKNKSSKTEYNNDKRKKIIQFMKRIAIENNTDFRRDEFKMIILARP